MNLKQAMIESLVDGWHGDWKMGRVVAHAWVLIDEEPDNEQEKYEMATKAINARYIHASDRAQVFIPHNLPRLNDALWAARKRETCMAIGQREIGCRNVAGAELQIKVRERDKRTDWGTVK